MTDKEFAATVKLFKKARDAALKLSQYQLWADEAEVIAELLTALTGRMEKQ